jgi:microcin C transport system substrate-binding protein
MRRLTLFLVLLLSVAQPVGASQANEGFVHGLALGASPRYSLGFSHFGYVNPQAPQGGTLRVSALGSFDKLNPFTLKGVAAKGVMDLVFESLTIGALDEPMATYGLLAQEMRLAKDGRSVTFRLRPQARFSNGDPVTAQDVKFSFDTLRGALASPLWRHYWADVDRAVVIDQTTIKFEFLNPNESLPIIVGAVPVFSRKWGAQHGSHKSFDSLTLDPPIGSGPYVVQSVEPGHRIRYQKQPDYWGAQLGVRRGQFNFDDIDIRYFRDAFAQLQALQNDTIDLLDEPSPERWQRSFHGSAFSSGRLTKSTLEHSNAHGFRGLFFNLRRPNFQDTQVRQAIRLLYNFEAINQQFFFGQLEPTVSFFTNTPFAHPRLTSPPLDHRTRKRLALEQLAQAGWTPRNGVLVNALGRPMTLEILISEAQWERTLSPFLAALQSIGIKASIRLVDSSLYRYRINQSDFDMVVHWMMTSQRPGQELFFRFSSETAKTPGSENISGIQDPRVDQMITALISAQNDGQRRAAANALDETLHEKAIAIGLWHDRRHRIAHAAALRMPAQTPLYYSGEHWLITTGWWAPQGRPQPEQAQPQRP